MTQIQRYVSDDLTHFVGKRFPDDIGRQYTILSEILTERRIIPLYGLEEGPLPIEINPKARLMDNDKYMPRIVSFSDIPWQDLYVHIKKYGRCGISFGKEFLIQHGANPVFYVERNSSSKAMAPMETSVGVPSYIDRMSIEEVEKEMFDLRQSVISNETIFNRFDDLWREFFLRTMASEGVDRRDKAILFELNRILQASFFSFIKSFDSGLSENDPENFYMEREWRLLGDLRFDTDDVSRIIIPKEFGRRFRQEHPSYYGEIMFL